MSYDFNLSTIDNAPSHQLFSYKRAERRNKNTYFYGERPVEWCINKGLIYYKLLINIPYPRRLHLPDLGEDSYEIHKFLLSLDGFQESEETELDLIPWIIQNTCLLGNNFAKILKKYRQDRFINTIIGRYSDKCDFERIPVPNIIDIGQILNYAYLPHWKTNPDEIDDYKYGFIEVIQEEKYLKEFSLALEELLEETNNVEEIKKEEILIKITSSKSFDIRTEKSDYNWKLKEKGSKLSSSIGLCKRCIIDIGPDNIRDTILTQSDSLNSINLIDRQTMEVIQGNENNYMVNKRLLKEKRFSRLKNFDPFGWYFMRDIKKEGITKPRNLLKLMIRGLHKKFPNFDAYQYEGFYDDFELLLKDGSKIKPLRGHGLGMANSLTTLMQLVIDRMISNKLLADGIEIDYDTLVINDDHVAVFHTESDLDEFDNIDFEILKGLGLIRNQEKSIIAQRGFVLCERYFKSDNEGINKKESYIRRECLLPLLSRNIVEAKRIVNSLVRHDNVDLMMLYLKEFIDAFGYEFFPEEANYPITFGGWLSFNIAGVKLDLTELDKQAYRSTVYKAYQACKHDRISIKTRGKDIPYHSPLCRIYPFLKDEEVIDLIGGTTHRKIIDKFFRFSDNPVLENQAWDRLNKKRRREFHKTKCPILSVIDFYSLIYKESKCLIYPPSILIKQEIYPEFQGELPKDFYLGACPLLSAIACTKEYGYISDLPEKYSIQFPVSDSFSFLTGNARAISQKLALISEDIFFPNMTYEPNYLIPEQFYDTVIEEWYNPGRIARASEFLTGNTTIPIISIEKDSTILDLKKSVYGRILRQDEISYFVANQLERKDIKFLVQIRDLSDPEFEKDVFKLFDDTLYDLYKINLVIPEEEIKKVIKIEFKLFQLIEKYEILYKNSWTDFFMFLEFFSANSQKYDDFKGFISNNFVQLNKIRSKLIKGKSKDAIKIASYIFYSEFQTVDRSTIESFLYPVLAHLNERIRVLRYPEKSRSRLMRANILAREKE